MRRPIILALAILGILLVGCSTGSTGAGNVPTPTATAVPKPTATEPEQGLALLGGSLSAFEAKYKINNGAGFCSDQACDYLIGVVSKNGIATEVSVVADGSPSDATMFNQCQLFLPLGATKTGTSGLNTTYQSPIGTVTLQLEKRGGGELFSDTWLTWPVGELGITTTGGVGWWGDFKQPRKHAKQGRLTQLGRRECP